MLFGAHPAAIRNDGVDFSVVGGVAERLRKIPRWLGVGGIALVKNDEIGFESGIAQVLIKLGKLPGSEQTFVDDGLRRERADVTSRGQQRFGFFAKQREAPLETFGWTRGVEWRDEKLPAFRHGFKSAAAEAFGIYGDTAPTEDAEALLIGRGFDGGLCVGYSV